MSGIKHISILLLFSFSILIGHNLVPHQHHSENLTPSKSHACPLDHNDTHDKHTGTKHCHAFNDIDFVTYKHVGIPGPVSVHTTLVLVDPANVPDPVEETELSHLFRLKLAIYAALSSGPPSLRGPPSVV